MNRYIFTFIFTMTTMIIVGCGGGGDSKEEVVKDATYYKKVYEDYTSIKSLNTEKSTLFTLDSLEKSLDELNVTGLGDTEKTLFVEQFKSNLESKVANSAAYSISNKTAIILPNDKESAYTVNGNIGIDLSSELTDAWETISNCCEEEEPPPIIVIEFIANLEDLADVDDDNDTQPFVTVLPDASEEIKSIENVELNDMFYGGSFVDVQMLKEEFGTAVDENVK
ncbi:MAG TPA: hypothetical protein ENK98_09540 [Epsilonproteobacteria bacterium]|nr:hypothetical protein [Campylobacterota bacterium]